MDWNYLWEVPTKHTDGFGLSLYTGAKVPEHWVVRSRQKSWRTEEKTFDLSACGETMQLYSAKYLKNPPLQLCQHTELNKQWTEKSDLRTN